MTSALKHFMFGPFHKNEVYLQVKNYNLQKQLMTAVVIEKKGLEI